MQERKYTFKLDNVNPLKSSKPEIIKSLKDFFRLKNNQPFTMREYDKWTKKPISAGSISKIFGSWSEAMKQAGLKSSKNLKKDLVEMVEIFKDAWEYYDAKPSGKQLDKYLKQISAPYTYRVYCHTFGNIGRLVERIIRHQQGKITDSELSKPYVPKNIRESISPKIRFEVLQRDGNQCVKCGASPTKDKETRLEVDHIIPVAKGGKNNMSNLQTLCQKCNLGKSDRND
jgi:5-methylcytosine-specific restriction endonuclease McrA